MANYPYTAHMLDSDITPESGVDDDFSQSGIQHSRILHDAGYYRFRLLHSLTLTEYNTLRTFYDTYPRTFITLTYYAVSPAVTYNVKFILPPAITKNHGSNRLEVEVHLRGYKN